MVSLEHQGFAFFRVITSKFEIQNKHGSEGTDFGEALDYSIGLIFFAIWKNPEIS